MDCFHLMLYSQVNMLVESQGDKCDMPPSPLCMAGPEKKYIYNGYSFRPAYQAGG
jgi:hypothetical protein